MRRKKNAISLTADKKKTYFSVQVREGTLRFFYLLIYERVRGCAQLTWAVSRNAGSWTRYSIQLSGMSSFVMTMLQTHCIQINIYSKVVYLLYNNWFYVPHHNELYFFFPCINTPLSKKTHGFVRFQGHFPGQVFSNVPSTVAIHLGK